MLFGSFLSLGNVALIKMLPSYYQHVCRYESSFLTKFFGVHCDKPVGGIKKVIISVICCQALLGSFTNIPQDLFIAEPKHVTEPNREMETPIELPVAELKWDNGTQ
ncbi:hypothetical protein L1987_46334 [Smallanthus sonchifolius]|uniref:Uncharacterized protein n=1 Tax=Smallanthus sonchifolius TaxID=185202 RepID=A0ACB9G020_9ASTR|nr:hypothetical protein L1987_46334 [Smallanthus sonchifolius]